MTRYYFELDRPQGKDWKYRDFRNDGDAIAYAREHWRNEVMFIYTDDYPVIRYSGPWKHW